MQPTISIFNPSNRARASHVTVPWNEFRQHYTPDEYPEDEFVLHDHANCEVPYQIDSIDPDDPSKKCLVLALNSEVPSRLQGDSKPSMSINVSRGQPNFSRKVQAELHYRAGSERGITLANDTLRIFFNFLCILDVPTKLWYAGSATTVQLHGRELLALGDWLQHDLEKRCMQVDHLYLPSHSRSTEFDLRVDVFNKDYRYVTHSAGPVRATVTVASAPFDYIHSDAVTGIDHTVQCCLYRVLSLYAEGDYVEEELYIKDLSNSCTASDEAIVPRVIIRYFNHTDFGHMPNIFQFANIPGWFAVSANWSGRTPGYGFGTTGRTSPVAYPHRDTTVLYDDPVHEKEFSWLLFPCTSAKNIHIFMRRNGRDFDDETGRRWYDIIYRGMKARVVSEVSTA